MFPWGEPGTALENFEGPDVWATEMLSKIGQEVRDRRFNFKDAVMPVLFATSSGHGIGKSAMVSWIVFWLMDTRVNCKGVITASTLGQLEKKTWPEIGKWYRLKIVGQDWVEFRESKNNLKIFRRGYENSWKFDGVSPNESNSEAFAGQHANDSSSIYIFDEASGVPDKIWDVAQGGMTDGEPHMYVFGNGTKKTGKFFEICTDRLKYRSWIVRKVDSRSVRITNKALLNEWVQTYGEDSDFVRVRIKGDFPTRGGSNLFDSLQVREAMRLGKDYIRWLAERASGANRLAGYVSGGVIEPGYTSPGYTGQEFFIPSEQDALRAGLDVARFGNDGSILSFRRGRDAASIPWCRYNGMDLVELSDRAADDCARAGVDGLFIDAVGIGAGVYDMQKRMNPRYDVFDIVGSRESSKKNVYKNKRTELYFETAAWVASGCMLDDNEDLYRDMEAITFEEMDDGRLLILPKRDLKIILGRSPDNLDSLATTFDKPSFQRRVRSSKDRNFPNAGYGYGGAGSWQGY
jgi:hypothetical protein